MREASYVCALLDNAAALGNFKKLATYATRWAKRDWNPKAPRTLRQTIWYHAGQAALYRASAVRARLNGDMLRAVNNENAAETHLQILAKLATREA